MTKNYKKLIISSCGVMVCLGLLAGCADVFSSSYDYHYLSGSTSSVTSAALSSAVSSAPASSQSIVAPATAFIDKQIKTSFTPVINRFYYNTLTTQPQRDLYDALLSSLVNLQSKTKTIKGDFTKKQIEDVMNAVNSDYPQIFYLFENYNINTSESPTGQIASVYLDLSYLYKDTSRIPNEQKQLYQAVNEILAGAASYSDAFERQLYIYEQVANKASYDFSEAATPGTNPYAHGVYGALVQGKAVCDGYAKALQLLYSYAGIDSSIVYGESKNQSHAWNMVTLGGVVYYNDVTWDDIEGWYLLDKKLAYANNGVIPAGAVTLPVAPMHQYLNVGYTQLTRDHIFDAAFAYPQQNNMVQNYFVKKNLIVNDENFNNKVVEQLRMAVTNKKPFIEFRLGSGVVDDTTMQKVINAIPNSLADELGISHSAYMTDSKGSPSFAVFIISK